MMSSHKFDDSFLRYQSR